MRVILYDCRDHTIAKYRGCTLRIIGDSDCGLVEVQGWMAGTDPRAFATRLAAGLGVELEYVGPPAEDDAETIEPVGETIDDDGGPAIAPRSCPTLPHMNEQTRTHFAVLGQRSLFND